MLGTVKKGIKSLSSWMKGEAEQPAATENGKGGQTATFEEEMNEAAAHFEGGRPEPAEVLCRQILACAPDHPKALNLLGVLSFLKGQREEGMSLLNRAIEVKPDFASAHSNLGNALKELGQLKKAEQCYRRALMLKPDHPDACSNLGLVLGLQDRLDEAEECLRKALLLRPDRPDDLARLGQVLYMQGKQDEALHCYRRTLELKPDHRATCQNLGLHHTERGNLDEAIALYRNMLALTPHRTAHSNLLLCLNYHPGISQEEIFREHLQWDLLYGRDEAEKALPHRNDRSPERLLRIGYVSPDFGQHPIGFFLSSVLPAHDRGHFQIYSYSGRSKEDDLTVRLRKSSDVWRVTKPIGDDQLAEQIRADGIDILVDLSGHTRENRLATFAQKPAPVQMTWAGYVGTTGLSAIDYLISDRFESPEGAEKYCCEKILRLPNGYLCYEAPPYAPPVSPLPALENGFVTFGCFNNPAKVTPQTVVLWARILRELPTARLLLKYKGYDDREMADRLLSLFANEGVEGHRIELSGMAPNPELLACYQRVDIALDPFPYSGGLTTMEALWMGVPVVTLAGERFCSRHSVSHLSVVGVPELIAADADNYLAIALGLARDLPRLASLRASLRERMAGSPMCDAAGFTRDLENAFRAAWRTWCREG